MYVCMCRSDEVYADDHLFAMLDPKSRKISLPGVCMHVYSLICMYVYADDLLFATLDPTSRKIRLPGVCMHVCMYVCVCADPKKYTLTTFYLLRSILHHARLGSLGYVCVCVRVCMYDDLLFATLDPTSRKIRLPGVCLCACMYV